MGEIVGIDLGTTTSVVSTVLDKEIVIIPNKKGQMIIPSVVSFIDNNRIIVGRDAKERLLIEPGKTVYSVKRLIGRKFFSREVKKARAVMPYEILEGENDAVKIKLVEREYTPEEISAFILKELKKQAEDFLGKEVDKAVITVPAYFNDSQRQSTKDAGTIAGLEVLKIINEPTSAALAYGFGKGLNQRIAIYDLGGGTFDVSILNLGDDVFEVISTAGDDYLGGDDFDDRIIDYAAESFMKEYKLDIRNNKLSLQKLKRAAEDAKIALTENQETVIKVNDIFENEDGEKFSLDLNFSRNMFANLTYDLVQKTFKVCDEALQNAHITIGEVDAVILVGGSTKMPIIREAVESYFFKKPLTNIDPELVVSSGAAIHAVSLVGETEEKSKSLLIDVTSRSLGLETVGGLMEMLIPRNSPIPTESSKNFTTARDNQTSVKIKIFQGESKKVAENELLGELVLSGLKPMPRGKIKIEIIFEIDSSGIVHISAIDKETGLEKETELNIVGGMSKDDVDRAKEDSDLVSL